MCVIHYPIIGFVFVAIDLCKSIIQIFHQKYQEMRASHTRETFVVAVQELGVKEGMWETDRVINRNILQSMINWANQQVKINIIIYSRLY